MWQKSYTIKARLSAGSKRRKKQKSSRTLYHCGRGSKRRAAMCGRVNQLMNQSVNKRDGRRARLSVFARRLLSEWKARAWPVSGEAAVVAVSGGADSMALLLAVDELLNAGSLELKLIVAHLNHGLRDKGGEEDALWVKAQARTLGYECALGRADAGARARASRDNLEQAARLARYEFLGATARGAGARLVLVAHTLDDQAETVLLRLLRGSGTEGLGGMRPERTLDRASDVLLLRPLLNWARREETESYCRARGFDFRVDEMNADENFARVRVRRKLLPLLETFNPRAREAVSRAAALLREDSEALKAPASKLLDEAADKTFDDGGDAACVQDAETACAQDMWPLRVDVLVAAPPALRRRALRLWIERGRGDLRRTELTHLLGVEKLLAGDRGGRVAELPGGGSVERRRRRLIFHGKRVEKGLAEP